MDEIQNDIERLYSPGEVALHMDIERQTVTKYARIFEDNGYNFHKDEKGNRLYTDTNIMMFKDLITQRNKPGITLEAAAKSLVAIYKSKSITDTVTDLPAERTHYDDDIKDKLDLLMLAFQKVQKENEDMKQDMKDIKQQLDQQKGFNEALIEQLKQSDRASIERHKWITDSLKQSMETQKQIAAATAAKEEEVRKQKKSFFARLLGR